MRHLLPPCSRRLSNPGGGIVRTPRSGQIALALLALAFLVCALPLPEARAHRIITGVGSQAVFTLRRDEIIIEFNVEFASLVGFQEMKKFDKNRDGNLSDEERRALVDHVGERIKREIGLFLDNKKLEPTEFVLTDDRSILKGPLDVLPWETWWEITYKITPMVPDENYSLVFLDNTYEGEIAQQALWVPSNQIEVDNFIFESPPDPDFQRESFVVMNKRRVEMRVGVLDIAPMASTTGKTPDEPFRPKREKQEEQKEVEGISELMRKAVTGPAGLSIALLISIFWGAGHALMPGHGKSMVAAYLVGTKGRVKDAVLLGGVATFAHTFSIFIIGGLLIWVFYETMDRAQATIQTWVGIGSGALVASIGLFILPQRIRIWKDPEAAHHHHDHGHSHGVVHSHGDDHAAHEHHDHPDEHAHGASRGGEGMERTRLISLGFSGGVVPCPTGLVIIVMSFTMKEPVIGLTLLFAFSLGLGLVLVSIGVALVLGKSALSAMFGRNRWKRLMRVMPAASAFIIILVGFLISYSHYIEGVRKGVFN